MKKGLSKLLGIALLCATIISGGALISHLALSRNAENNVATKGYVDKTQNVELPVQEGQWDGFIASILDPDQTPRIGFLTGEQKAIIQNYNIIILRIPARVAPYLGLVGEHAFRMIKRDSFSGSETNENYIMFDIFHDDGVIISFGFREDINALYLNDIYEINKDTKNTAGATNSTSTKLFLIGSTEQSANPQTYSNINTYLDSSGHLVTSSGFLIGYGSY